MKAVHLCFKEILENATVKEAWDTEMNVTEVQVTGVWHFHKKDICNISQFTWFPEVNSSVQFVTVQYLTWDLNRKAHFTITEQHVEESYDRITIMSKMFSKHFNLGNRKYYSSGNKKIDVYGSESSRSVHFLDNRRKMTNMSIR